MTPCRAATTLRQSRPRGAARAAVRRGLSMIEAGACTLIVALLVTAALHTAGAAKVTQNRAAELVQAQTLAQALLTEVMQKPFLDPAVADPSNPGPIGIETGETPTLKTTFDDVDDYNNWFEAPPQDTTGVKLTDRNEWRREVAVQWVDASDLTTRSTSATPAKRVTVTVLRNDRKLATASAVRTNAP
jgi:hypothetical protein